MKLYRAINNEEGRFEGLLEIKKDEPLPKLPEGWEFFGEAIIINKWGLKND